MSLYHQALHGLEGKEQVVVVIGAMDGVAHDELGPYIKRCKLWLGLLVEPVPSYFEELRKNYADRTNLIFENVAITEQAGSFDIYTVNREAIAKGEVPHWCNGISTLHKDGPTIGREGIKDKVRTQKITGVRFEELVQKHNLTNIDILQIDAEGHDYTIFEQIWNLGFKPTIIYIEIVHMAGEEIKDLTSLLQTNGYELERSGDNLAAVKQPKVNVAKSKKRVAFYTYPQWAFGAIHSALCKELYPYNIDADILDWNVNYTHEDWRDLERIYDVFVTVPGSAVVKLLENGVPYSKIIAIAHGRYDIEAGVHLGNDWNAFLKVGCIASSLATFAKQCDIARDVIVLRNGIHFDRFYQAPAQRLTSLGYAGSLTFIAYDQKTDCKRSHLVQRIAEQINVPIRLAGQRSFIRMPEYYKDVDCVVVSSDAVESCALPLMEAAAAGRLPISAKIGIASEFANPTGLILPLEEDGFVRQGIERLNVLKENEGEFHRLCTEAQEFARQNYDWSCVIKRWVDILA